MLIYFREEEACKGQSAFEGRHASMGKMLPPTSAQHPLPPRSLPEDQEEEEMAKEEEKGAHGHQAPRQGVPVVKGRDGCVSGPAQSRILSGKLMEGRLTGMSVLKASRALPTELGDSGP